MLNRKYYLISGIIFIVLLLKVFVPAVMAGDSGRMAEVAAQNQLEALTPVSIGMVDQAMTVLGQGWTGMTNQEKELFLALYDPAGTGTIDDEFVETVYLNFQKIRETLNRGVPVSYENEHDLCIGQRLYYTDYISLHVCPFFFQETNENRQARELVHEYAHIALRVKDRPYYRPTSLAFAKLTPRGHRAAGLPLIGPLVREIMASDTLYHPDAYAHFALAMSNQPEALGFYLASEPGENVTTVVDHDNIHEHATELTDSWQRP
jgi:hypothetical protein